MVVAERLGMTVYRLRREMPMGEIFRWFRYFKGEKEPSLDLANASPDELAKAFGG